MTKKIKDRDIIEAYRAAEGLKQSEMARALGVSRQALSNYIRGLSSPETMVLLRWYRDGTPDWAKEMALEIFARRPDYEVPCICLETIGDNGPCPKHSAVLVDEA